MFSVFLIASITTPFVLRSKPEGFRPLRGSYERGAIINAFVSSPYECQKMKTPAEDVAFSILGFFFSNSPSIFAFIRCGFSLTKMLSAAQKPNVACLGIKPFFRKKDIRTLDCFSMISSKIPTILNQWASGFDEVSFYGLVIT